MSEFKKCHKIYEGFLYFPLNEAKGGCFLAIRFRTVCAVNAQTWLSSNLLPMTVEEIY